MRTGRRCFPSLKGGYGAEDGRTKKWERRKNRYASSRGESNYHAGGVCNQGGVKYEKDACVGGNKGKSQPSRGQFLPGAGKGPSLWGKECGKKLIRVKKESIGSFL